MDVTLKWLHLSDLHFHPTTKWRDTRATNSLLKYLRAVIRESPYLAPDFVFCTGDIAFGNAPGTTMQSQYDDACLFFDKVREICGSDGAPMPKERLFVVPGNHDINREHVNEDAQANLLEMARRPHVHVATINHRWHNVSREIRDALARLDEYKHFTDAYLPHQSDRLGRCCYALMTEIGAIKVGIAGLNSAWSSNGKEADDRHLWMAAESQFNEVASAIEDADVRVALIHHPADWLNEAERDVIMRRLGTDINFLLHGHIHNAWITPNQGHVTVAAGAIGAMDAEEFGVNIVNLNLTTRKGEVHLHAYSPRDGGWTQCSVPHRAPRGIWPFDVPISHPVQALAASGRAEGITDPHHRARVFGDFFIRPLAQADLDAYTDEVTGGEVNREVQQFSTLYKDCFGHHLVEELCGDPDALHTELDDESRIVDKDNLDAYFLRNSTIIPSLTKTANADARDQEDRRVTFQMFVKAVTDPPLRAEIPAGAEAVGENRVSYLIGDAGMGKTLTALKLIDTVRTMSPDYRGYRSIPVYLDLHEVEIGQESPRDAISGLTRKIIDKLVERGKGLGAGTLDAYSSSGTNEDVDRTLKHLALALAHAKFFPLLVFDNADRFYFENAKYSFFPVYAKERDIRIDDYLLHLIKKFVIEAEFGKIGASVLFVCRKYVFNHCRQIQDEAARTRAIQAVHVAYQLRSIAANDAMRSRFVLMRDAVTSVRKKYAGRGLKYATQVETLEEATRQFLTSGHDGSTIDMVWKLSHQGLRSFLEFLGRLELDYRKDYQLIDRLFGKPHNLLRLYITNLRKRYSQKAGHFPNLFLADALIDRRSEFPEAHKPHVHTYWLKYLLLRYAYLQPRHRVTSEQLIYVFTELGRYEPHLVSLAIGSLADPSEARCLDIVPRQQAAAHVQLLEVSDRGKVLVGQRQPGVHPFCFDFDYLQLIVDDYWLSLPRKWSSQIYVDASIGYTLKNIATYGDEAWRTLTKKIPAVLCFLRVLQASMSWEQKQRGELLDYGAVPELIPNLDEIGKSVVRGMEHVLASFGEKRISQTPEALWRELTADRSFEKFFDDYGESGALVSLDA